LSPLNFQNTKLAAVVAETIAANGLPPQTLMLEITEGVLANERSAAIETMNAIRKLGVGLSLDDFGTGYSSLAYLQRLPIDVLKIDKSFVSGMMVDPDAVAIVRAVLSLAEALGMSTTAEGIETVELATTLATLGCASGQGFYFAKPLEEQAALAYWKSRRHH